MAGDRVNPARPRLFIVGSSSDAKRIAEAIRLNLEREIESAVWNPCVFKAGEATVDALDRMSRDYDFVALVVTPEIVADPRGEPRAEARDNALFDAGLFIGRLGRERTFLVCPRDAEASLPSNLAGLTVAHYAARDADDLQLALGPASTLLKDAIDRVLGRPWAKRPRAAESSGAPPDIVPRPRRCNSLGIAVTRHHKEEFRIVNISVSGAFLETAGELPVGRILGLDLRLDDDSIVSLTAEVVRVQRPDWRRPGGVGVAFKSVPDDAARALEAFVAFGPRAA